MRATRSDRSGSWRPAGTRGLVRAALLGAVLGLPLWAVAAERAPLCLETKAQLAAKLDGVLWTARTTGGCAARAAFRGRFERRGAAVVFVLVPPEGAALEREVPWVSAPGGALERLADSGRLSAFAVLVEGLLAEQRLPAGSGAALGAAAASSDPAAAASAAAAAAVSAATASASAGGTRIDGRPDLRGRPGPSRPAAKAGPALAGAAPIAVASAAAAAGAAPAVVVPAAAAGPDPVVPPAAAAGPAPVTSTATAAVSPAAVSPAAVSPAAVSPAAVSPAAVSPAAVSPAAAPAAAAAAVPAASIAAEEPSEEPSASSTPGGTKLGGAPSAELALRTAAAAPVISGDALPVAALSRAAASVPSIFAPELFAGVRARLPGILAPELGVGITLREFFVHAGYQPEVTWSHGVPALAVSAVSFLGGYRLPLWRGDALQLRGTVGLAAERLVITELAAGTAPYAVWDAGAGAGAGLFLRPAPELAIGLEFLGFWLPTGRAIPLPDGSTAHLDAAAARLALTARWGSDP